MLEFVGRLWNNFLTTWNSLIQAIGQCHFTVCRRWGGQSYTMSPHNTPGWTLLATTSRLWSSSTHCTGAWNIWELLELVHLPKICWDLKIIIPCFLRHRQDHVNWIAPLGRCNRCIKSDCCERRVHYPSSSSVDLTSLSRTARTTSVPVQGMEKCPPNGWPGNRAVWKLNCQSYF